MCQNVWYMTVEIDALDILLFKLSFKIHFKEQNFKILIEKENDFQTYMLYGLVKKRDTAQCLH